MSGAPAFQANAFQQNAFQSGVQVVAGTYSLGSPVFATPALGLNYHLSAPSYSLQSPVFAKPGPSVIPLNVFGYSLGSPVFAKPGPLGFNYHFTATSWAVGSPVFAKPTLISGANFKLLSANPYSLGSPVFAVPSFRQVNGLRVNAYSLGSPVFSVVASTQTYRLFANFYDVASPEFATPRITENYQFQAMPYSLGSPDFAFAGPFFVNHVLTVNDYSLGSPAFNFPRLQTQVVELGLPPTYFTDAQEAANVLKGLCNLLLKSLPSSIGAPINTARRLIASLRDGADAAIRGTTLGTQLAQAYIALDTAGATYAGIDAASLYLFGQASSTSVLTQALYRSALVMNLGLESKIISRIKFKNQEQIQNMMTHVRDLFEQAKAIGIDDVDVLVYQTLTAMGGAIINHLNYTQLQAPRYVTYVSADFMPSLYLANRIYADASRSDEIEEENSIIHPAFCPLTIRVLSNVGS